MTVQEFDRTEWAANMYFDVGRDSYRVEHVDFRGKRLGNDAPEEEGQHIDWFHCSRVTGVGVIKGE